MGNSALRTSQTYTHNNFFDIINDIATNYIITSDFNTLKMLNNKDYCNDLIILTSQILQNNFTNLDLLVLNKQLKNGGQIQPTGSTENVKYINKAALFALENKENKQQLCNNIARFYVKIAHIFAAIMMTINPTYFYKDNQGNIIKKTLYDKNTIPAGVHPEIYKLNICDARINALNKTIQNDANGATDTITLAPDICSFNMSTPMMNDAGTNAVKTLENEPGIPELEKLYYDDAYDVETDNFNEMTPETRAQYQQDLYNFYVAFTGNSTMPPNITKFSDIKLRDYNSMYACLGDKAVFKTPINIKKSNNLYINYANNIKTMINNATIKQNKLLDIINVLFIYIYNPETNSKKITINPGLTQATLQNIIKLTRKYIIDLYIQCEKDYVNGIKLYQNIIQSKLFETTNLQINHLENSANNLLQEYKSINTKVPTNNNDMNYKELSSNQEQEPTLNYDQGQEQDLDLELDQLQNQQSQESQEINEPNALNNTVNVDNPFMLTPSSTTLAPSQSLTGNALAPSQSLTGTPSQALQANALAPSQSLQGTPSQALQANALAPSQSLQGTPSQALPGNTLAPSSQALPANALALSSQALPGNTLAPSSQALPANTLAPSSQALPANTLAPSSQALPANALAPTEYVAPPKTKLT